MVFDIAMITLGAVGGVLLGYAARWIQTTPARDARGRFTFKKRG
jgi:hypothetical protein